MTRFLNQNLILPQERMDNTAIGIIGTGAIGSFTAMALTKMGFKNIVTWDFDKIEEHNISNQMFPVDSVGKKKALATRTMTKQFSGEDIICLATKAEGKKAYEYLLKAFGSICHGYILVLAVDSLDVRKKIVEDLRGIDVHVIDARMGAKTYRVMSFTPRLTDQYQDYMRTLVPDAQAVQERCGQKSIIYTVLGVAAEVCSFINWIVMWGTEEDFDIALPLHPHPVTFDYGTGTRLQRPMVGTVMSLEDMPDPVQQPETPLPEAQAEVPA